MTQKSQEAKNGTYSHLIDRVATSIVADGPQHSCLVCDKVFSRDGILQTVVADHAGEFLHCDACDFTVPANFSERQIHQLAQQRIAYLRKQGA